MPLGAPAAAEKQLERAKLPAGPTKAWPTWARSARAKRREHFIACQFYVLCPLGRLLVVLPCSFSRGFLVLPFFLNLLCSAVLRSVPMSGFRDFICGSFRFPYLLYCMNISFFFSRSRRHITVQASCISVLSPFTCTHLHKIETQNTSASRKNEHPRETRLRGIKRQNFWLDERTLPRQDFSDPAATKPTRKSAFEALGAAQSFFAPRGAVW